MSTTPWSTLRATGYDAAYYEEHKAAGLDYAAHGAWQDDYGRWLVDALSLQGRRVLDVGCACGSIAAGLAQCGAVVDAIDLNNHAIALGRGQPWVKILRSLSVCDAVHLHLFADQTFDLVHANQTFEHLRPELVPFVLAELGRVLAPDGLLFTIHDTSEIYARQGRSAETEDPTHLCVRPRAWWNARFEAAGFRPAALELEWKLQDHPRSFFTRYDWDWWLLRWDSTPASSSIPARD